MNALTSRYRNRRLLTTLRLVCFGAIMALSAACDDSPIEAGPAPLRPLVYTEVPEITPGAAAVRERRIVRELVEGQGAGAPDEGSPTAPVSTVLSTPEALGAEMLEALFARDEARWDRIFVAPDAYARLVHVKPGQARDFVDEIQGASSSVWDLFKPASPSEAVDGGFPALFKLRAVELGAPRGLDGKVVEDDAAAVQYWNNRVVVDYRGRASFALTIPKVLRVGPSRTFALGSKVVSDSRLEVFLGAGLHLKEELLRTSDYPIPLQVGTFWRYRRQRPGATDDPLDVVDGTDAATVIVEVLSVDRYDTMRLVKLRRSYDDAELSKADRYWLVTPRRVDLCDRGCRGHIDDLGWILDYMRANVPIYAFPIRNEGWGPYEVVPMEPVDVPAGVFSSLIGIDGKGPLGMFDRRLRVEQRRVFSFGNGVVRRELGKGDNAVVEELVEYRIMP